MRARITRILIVFAAVGLLFALTRHVLPAWMHLTVLAGGLWIAFRLWQGDLGGRGRRGR